MKHRLRFLPLLLVAFIGSSRAEDNANLVSVLMRSERISEAVVVVIRLTGHAITIDPSVAATPRYVDFTATRVPMDTAISALEHELREQCGLVIERKSDSEWIARVDQDLARNLHSLPLGLSHTAGDQQRGDVDADIEIKRSVVVELVRPPSPSTGGRKPQAKSKVSPGTFRPTTKQSLLWLNLRSSQAMSSIR